MRILLSNDDGVQAEGIWALHDALVDHAEILVVAPEREQSASSHALTLHQPLRLRQVEARVFAVDGTPTDCVLMAIRGLGGRIDFVPDLVLSGINHGPNLGDDVTYSGTVAAAFEGHLLGLPSIAFSNVSSTTGFRAAAAAARDLVLQLARREPMPRLLLNVNFPDAATYRGFRLTHLGHRRYEDVVDERVDPRGRSYFWLGGSPSWDDEPRSDMAALKDGFVSVTPMHLALTDLPLVETMSGWGLELSGDAVAEPAAGAGPEEKLAGGVVAGGPEGAEEESKEAEPAKRARPYGRPGLPRRD